MVSNKPWGDFTKADYNDEQWQKACLYCDSDCLDDGTPKQCCKLPVKEPDGTLNRNGVIAAYSALRGARGGVKGISDAEKEKLFAKLKTLYKEAEIDIPEEMQVEVRHEVLNRQITMDFQDGIHKPEITQKEKDGGYRDFELVALKPDKYHGVNYTSEVLKEGAKTWVEKEDGNIGWFMLNHTSDVRDRAGPILDSYYCDEKDLIIHKGRLTNREAIKLYDDGLLTTSSVEMLVGIDMEKSKEDELYAAWIRGTHNAFVHEPACSTCGLEKFNQINAELGKKDSKDYKQTLKLNKPLIEIINEHLNSMKTIATSKGDKGEKEIFNIDIDKKVLDNLESSYLFLEKLSDNNSKAYHQYKLIKNNKINLKPLLSKEILKVNGLDENSKDLIISLRESVKSKLDKEDKSMDDKTFKEKVMDALGIDSSVLDSIKNIGGKNMDSKDEKLDKTQTKDSKEVVEDKKLGKEEKTKSEKLEENSKEETKKEDSKEVKFKEEDSKETEKSVKFEEIVDLTEKLDDVTKLNEDLSKRLEKLEKINDLQRQELEENEKQDVISEIINTIKALGVKIEKANLEKQTIESLKAQLEGYKAVAKTVPKGKPPITTHQSMMYAKDEEEDPELAKLEKEYRDLYQ